MDPLTIAAVGATLASGAMTASSQMKSAKATRQIAEYNQRISERNAEAVRVAAAHNRLLQKMVVPQAEKVAGKLLAKQQVGYAKAGVTGATPAAVMIETSKELELQMARVDMASRLQLADMNERATGHFLRGVITRATGEARAAAYERQAVASLLGSAASAATIGL